MLFSTVTSLSIKPKAPFLENETTKEIVCRHSGKGSEMLQWAHSGCSSVRGGSCKDWDLHPLLQFIKALTPKEGARDEEQTPFLWSAG